MDKSLRNFLLDSTLFLLLGLNLASLGAARAAIPGAQPGAGWHIHAISGTLMMIACLAHIALHWKWFRAVLAGKARGRVKLIMNGIVTICVLLATPSGHLALDSSAAASLHDAAGALALLGLSVHAVRHVRWMASTSARLIAGGRLEKASPAS